MNQRNALAVVLIAACWACDGQPGSEAPLTSDTGGVTATGHDSLPVPGGFSTEITVSPEIAAAWTGVRVRLIDRETGTEETFEIPLGGADMLGDSGLVLSAGAFLPDFIMDERGISSRSPEPINPAVRVVISGDGIGDFEGWLFAAMPEIHPFPHDRYQVLLVEGIPAD